jgi:hypothetical protein
MTYFAKLDENNIVVFVTAGRQEDDGLEEELNARTGDVYRQTSYNTHGGIHYTDREPSEDQTKAFRGTYAGIGFYYDEDLDIFHPPQPYASWTLNAQTASWEPPVDYPADGGQYVWDEEAGDWVEVPEAEVE